MTPAPDGLPTFRAVEGGVLGSAVGVGLGLGLSLGVRCSVGVDLYGTDTETPGG
jgi:hypothetical protein